MTDNVKNQLIINRLDKTQYDTAGTIDNQEIYLVDPMFKGNRIVVTDENGGLTEAEATMADIPGVINSVTSTSTTDALSANMGKELQEEIDNLKARGRFLALWNCATGLPASNPTESPYLYKAGDYYVIGTIASGSGTNYKPNGATYVADVPSTTVETSEVAVDDVYYYDGTQWRLQSNAQKTLSFVNIAGDPYDNTNLANALNSKIDDVQINNTSIVTDKIAYIPKASSNTLGTIMIGSGLAIQNNGSVYIVAATESNLINKLNGSNPVVSTNLNVAIREGLGNNSLTWTDAYKLSARKTIGAVGGVTVGGEDVVNSSTTVAELPYPVVFVNYED